METKEMKKESFKEKAAKFYEENKLIIGYAAGVAVSACIAAGYDIWRCKHGDLSKSRVLHDNIRELLDDSELVYNSKEIVTGIQREGFIPADLGKLGEKIIELGIDEKQPFTHFIAIGETPKDLIN